MDKKKIYTVVFIIVVILGYFNYFGEEKDLTQTEQVIETSNVTYTNEDYVVEAEKQKDYIKENETGFEKAKAKVNDMFISGDNVLIDKVRNLALKNNILGISPNGWKFQAESIDYNKLKDEVSSTTGVIAINEKEGVQISGKNFTTDSKMSYITLSENVKLENKDILLKGDRGDYNDLTKIVILSDNIKLEGKEKNATLIDGNFKTLKYNLESRVLEAWEPYDVTYKGVKISADSLYFKEDTEALKVSKNVVIEVEGFKIDVDRLEKNGDSNILNIYGKIKGDNGIYSFEGDSGSYNIDSKILTIVGNINGKSTKGEKIKGEKLVYDSNTKLMTLSGKKNVEYSSKDGTLITKAFNYNSDTKEFTTDGAYTFKGIKYESEGKSLYYNDLTKDVKVTKGYLLDKSRGQKIKGDSIAYNTETRDSSIVGDAYMEDRRYSLSSDTINYTGSDSSALISGDYLVKTLDKKMSFKGKNAKYNQVTGDFISEGAVLLQGENYIARGNNLTYNSKSGFGKLDSQIEIENSKENLRVKGDKFSFQNGEYLIIDENIYMEGKNIIANSKRAKYNLKDKKIYLPEKIDFVTKDGKTSGKSDNGVYYTETGKFVGNNFNGKSDENTLTSKKITYFSDSEKILFQGDVVIKNEESRFKGENVEYYPNSETINSLTDYVIDYRDFTFKGAKGTFNNKEGILRGERSDITSTKGDKFISDRFEGNLNEMILDFIGNVKGYVDDNGVKTNFQGNFARVYFKNSGKYEILRSEVRGDAIFVQDEKTLKSDYIEIDSTRRLVLSKENTKLIISDRKNGDTMITSSEAEVDIEKDIAILIGNVHIENNNKEYGITDVSADKGIIKKNEGTLELIGNVEIENNESIVQADRGIYNMNSKKIKASGNVYVDYKK